MRMRRKDGSEFDALITSSVWQDGELNAEGYQGIVRDVTERRRIEAELEQHRHHLEELVQVRTAEAAAELAERQLAQEALQRRIEELSALNEIANTISTVTDIQTTLEHVAGKVADLFAAPAALITLLDREHSQVKLMALYTGLALPEPHSEGTFDLDEVPVFRQVADQNKPLVLADAQSSPLLAGMHDLLQTLGTHSLLLVPLRVHSDVIGVMTIHNMSSRIRIQQQMKSILPKPSPAKSRRRLKTYGSINRHRRLLWSRSDTAWRETCTIR